MNAAELDPKRFPQTTSVQEWVAAERAKGLVDIKFFARPTDKATLETFSTDVNAMRASATICTNEVL